MEIKAKIIISRFKEDYSWVEEYTDNYVVYNKGELIENDSHVLNVENLGGNQRDIFDFLAFSIHDTACIAEIWAHFEQVEAFERWGSVLAAEVLVAAIYGLVADTLAGCE